jgi:YfiR/HmsC-like
MRPALVLLVWLVVAASLPARAQEVDREAALKAAFVYNFAKFTEWPTGRFRSETDPVLFCVGPNSRLKNALTVLPEKLVGTHPVRLLAVSDEAAAAACHVLFVDDTLSPRLRQLAETDLFGVLTVSDLPNFAHAGGGIGFYFASNQLRFQINLDAARRSGIGFSSKLLRLADVIGQQSSLPSRLAVSLFRRGTKSI